MSDLQHELHADSIFYQPHHKVGLTLEHPVVLPGQGVGVLNGEVKMGGWTEERKTSGQSHTAVIQEMSCHSNCY